MQKVRKTMPSRTGIPPDAQTEILQKLSAETKITSGEIAEILKKHDICGDIDALQDAYRKRLGQRLMSTIRDETGKREVLAASGGEYVIVDCCNDPQKLKAIRHRIQAQMNGLDVSAGKVRKRVRFLERFASWVRKETSDEAA
ncbi:synapsin-1 (Synapsin I) [Intestinimonas sp. MSJ-38]|uniref:synapsin-1 (Synapsin I) n=1 Tax=Intestinimonas sp. MSJ-38 TaxID=2841532 RepID=UPI001C0F51EF|nr:synapsin-1 (Synapsin I) [Intestinimonas sp. MSJ-38]MBU5431467.1 synapsin-1 (Synapsin I) [Intestinimonas sp. MSJ-38]